MRLKVINYWFKTDLLDPGVLSLWRRFLNQFETCVRVSPVFLASCLFSSGVGYLKIKIYIFNHKKRFYTCYAYTFLLMSSLTFLWSNKLFLLRPKSSLEVDIFVGVGTYQLPLKQQIYLEFTINEINVLAQ